MQKHKIRILVLTAIFIVALFASSHLVNRGNAGMTANMSQATLPTVSFTVNGKEINPLVGHMKEMEVSAVRDTVLPLDGEGNATINIQKYGQKIESLTYAVLNAEGTEKLTEKKKEKVGESVVLDVGDFLKKEEALLRICLNLSGEKKAYYYTRLVKGTESYFPKCMDYVATLHENILEKKDTGSIEKVLESDAEGDNTTLQHVTIHSNLEHVTWGDLTPKVVGNIRFSVQEIKPAYTSICLKYQVECMGDDKEKDIHNVKEFFRVRYEDDKYYLLTYDRTLEEKFQGSKESLTSKAISLGLVDKDTKYMANEAGNIASFVQANELWSYNEKESEFALVFSFADSEKEDSRHLHDAHSIKILSMEENGSVTFAVYGYMNRGEHEGESGVAVYYFNLSQNVVEEKAFIPSNQSYVAIEKEMGKLAYYNDKDNMLYVMAAGELCKVDLETNKKTAMLKGLESNQYVSSENGQMIGYQKTNTQVVVSDFSKNTQQKIEVTEGEVIKPLGFVMGDFVYGVARQTDVGKLPSGETVLGMYKLEIRDSKNKVVKEYQAQGSFLIGVQIEGNMITLERATLQGGIYTEVSEDYITNNEEKLNMVSLESYQTEVKETQYRLVFEEEIKDKNAKVLRPRQVLFERDTTMNFDTESNMMYSVYGAGEIQGVYKEAGEAIRVAKKTSGVVISPKQNYVWEDGNRVSWYRNFEINAFHVNPGETSLTACVRAVLSYEEATVDVTSELAKKSAFEILNDNCGKEAVQMKDGSSADMRYLIDKGIPVIALTGSDGAVLLVGYDAKTVTYIDPNGGVARTRNFSAVDAMVSGSGNTFWAYLK